MILLDTSAWIYFFKKGWPTELEFDEIVTTLPVIQEILQGIRNDDIYLEVRESIFNLPILCNPIDLSLYERAAEIYRFGRKKGLTIRSSVDCLISAIAIEDNIPIMHNDRDFDNIATYTPLKIFHLRNRDWE